MKKLKYILIFILSIGLFNSCLIDNTTDLDQNDEGSNVVTFETINFDLSVLADGSEYEMEIPVRISGPTVTELTNDITVTFSSSALSTAIENDEFRIDNPTIVLKKSNNYIGHLVITLMSEGNSAPMDGTPAFEIYVAPKLYLEISATGDANVVGSGKGGCATLNFTPPNPYAGMYSARIKYWRNTDGVYPTDPWYDEVNIKELKAITGRKCETTFGLGDWSAYPCWITVNMDNSITYKVDDSWGNDVTLVDPFDDTKISHYDPETGKIYLYYTYTTTGWRVFWEEFTPLF